MRRILALSGKDRETFLQGLVTNDVRRAPVWAALLTPQGKYLADFLIVPDGERLLIDVDEALAGDLIRRLSMYKLRADVTLEPTDLGLARGTGPAPEGVIADPRDPALGWRLYGAATGDDGSDWDAIRVAHTIPETLIELIPNETFILEAGFERLHGVDFRKGCYVGQEVTARMKHKTELRKGLVTLGIDGQFAAVLWGHLLWVLPYVVLTLAASYEDWRELSESLLEPLSPDDRAAILHGNAARFYGVAA